MTRPKARPLESAVLWILVVAGLALTLDTIWTSLDVPMLTGDESAIWSAKAKAMYGAATNGPPLHTALHSSFVQHADYPPLNPLLQVFACWIRGEPTFAFQRVPIQAMSVALLLAFAAAVRTSLRPIVAALFLLAFIAIRTTIEGARTAEADAMLALGFLLALDAWCRFAHTGESRWWRLCCVALAFAACTKHEGAMLLACFLGGLALDALRRTSPARAALGRGVAWLLPSIAVIAGTWAFNRALELEHDMLQADADGGLLVRLIDNFPDRLGPVLTHFVLQVYGSPARTGLFAVVFITLLAAARRQAFRMPSAAATWVLLGACAAYPTVFLGTFQDLDWHLDTAASRITFQIVPALGLWSATMLATLAPRFGAETETGQPKHAKPSL